MIGLVASGEYSLAVRPENGVKTVVSIPRSTFDCNDSAMDIAVASDGTVGTSTVSTQLGCSGGLF